MGTRRPIQQVAVGSGHVQIGGIVIINGYEVTPVQGARVGDQLLNPDQRAELTHLAEEIVQAEGGIITTKLVRASLNDYIGVGSVTEMTADCFERAVVYLTGWRNCAAGKELSQEASIAQILRMWAIVPGLRGVTNDFARATFGFSMLKNMTAWELRSTLAFVMAKWQNHWRDKPLSD